MMSCARPLFLNGILPHQSLSVIPLLALVCFQSLLDTQTSAFITGVIHPFRRGSPVSVQGQAEFFVSGTAFSFCLGGGISSYAGVRGGAARSLEACLNQALKDIPKFRHHQTPISLGATAGMRLLKSVEIPVKTGYHTIITTTVLINYL